MDTNDLTAAWRLLQVRQARIFGQIRDLLNAQEGTYQAEVLRLMDELQHASNDYAAKEERAERDAEGER